LKLSQIDCGGSHPWPEPKSGQTAGTVFIEGAGGQNYARGNSRLPHTFQFWVRAVAPIGGAAAGSPQALKYLLTEIQELVKNPDLQPVYLQPLATDESSAYSAASEFDGWYWLDAFESPYRGNINSGIVKATLQATPAGPATVRRVGQSFVGGALSSGYSATAMPWVAFPVNATPALSVTRTGSDGAIPIQLNPPINPAPFTPPPTIADNFKGACHVYDTLTVGGNAVPTSGIPLNTNWVEVFGPEHVFAGDVVVLNGLTLLRFQTGVTGTIATVWLWNWRLVTPAWQQWSTLEYVDNAGNSAVLQQVTLDRVGLGEVQLKAVGWTSAGNEAVDQIRLQRGAYGPRIEFRPQSQANTSAYGIRLTLVTAAKAFFNSSAIIDPLVAGSLAATSDYGYAGAIIANSSYPFIGGLLWQSVPVSQPAIASSTLLGVGDTAGPGQNLSRQYGLFAIPWLTPQNMQGEGESGTLPAGWSSIADGAGSAGNTAKAITGAGSSTNNIFGTSWVPPDGNYNVWFRVRVTSAAGAVAEMQLGLWDATSAGFVGSTTFKANQASTSYVWLLAAAGAVPVSGHNVRFAATKAATLGTDWFIDEAVLVPVTNLFGFPQDLARQFLSDARTELALA
jgi:hypothetical protein